MASLHPSLSPCLPPSIAALNVCSRPATYRRYMACWSALQQSLRPPGPRQPPSPPASPPCHADGAATHTRMTPGQPPASTPPSSQPASVSPSPTTTPVLHFSDIPWPPRGNPLFLEDGDGEKQVREEGREPLGRIRPLPGECAALV